MFKKLLLILFFLSRFLLAEAYLAVVVDDLGGSLSNCRRLLTITEPITLAVLPGQSYSQKCAKLITASPHQLLIHLPWSDLGKNYQKYYPIRLEKGMTKKEMSTMLKKALLSVPQADGFNNHMGSQFSASKADVEVLMSLLAQYRGKYFLDSRTSVFSKAYYLAQKYGIKAAKNNIFLDGRQSFVYFDRQLAAAVRLAKKTGPQVAICHGNRPITLKYLKPLMEKYKKEVTFVYLPDIIELRRQKEQKEIKLNQNKGL